MRAFKFIVPTIIVVGPAFLPAGCSKENNIDQSTANTYQQTIGMNGGLVGDPEGEGVAVFVPAGALLQDTTISISTAAADEYPPVPQGAVGQVYAFEPHGLTFGGAATMHLPKMGATGGTIMFAQPGGTWMNVEDTVSFSGKNATFSTTHFSYYVLVSNAQGPVDPAEPAPGTGGGGSGGGANGTGGSSGSTNRPDGGGEIPQSDECLDAPTAVAAGTTDATGTVASDMTPVSFAAVDGYAVIRKDIDRVELSLVFTEYTQACGYAEAANQKVLGDHIPRGGKQNSQVFVVHVIKDGASEVTAQEYGEPRASLNQLDTECMSKSLPSRFEVATSKVTISSVTDTHVAGTVTLEPRSGPEPGDSFSGSFNFPICEQALEDGSPYEECCLP